MKRDTAASKLIAIVGGSGAGKSWLALRLLRELGPDVALISQDNFYLDRSHLSPARREALNFDHPRAIDWNLLEQVLRNCRAGRKSPLPKYNFASHTRQPAETFWTPQPVVLVEGLWLLRRPSLRHLFDLRVFLACPFQLRLERRLARDVSERGRTLHSVREQFWKTVAPMHKQFVDPQVRWADMILQQPPGEAELAQLLRSIRALRDGSIHPGTTNSGAALTTSCFGMSGRNAARPAPVACSGGLKPPAAPTASAGGVRFTSQAGCTVPPRLSIS
jgi:uridine kinase